MHILSGGSVGVWDWGWLTLPQTCQRIGILKAWRDGTLVGIEVERKEKSSGRELGDRRIVGPKAEDGMRGGGCHQPRQTLWIRACTYFKSVLAYIRIMFVFIAIGVVLFLYACTRSWLDALNSVIPTYNLVFVKNNSASTRRPVLTQKTLYITQVKYVGYASTNRCQILLPFASK